MIPVRILGIDPGLRRTGWGLVTIEGTRLVLCRVRDGGFGRERSAGAPAEAVARRHRRRRARLLARRGRRRGDLRQQGRAGDLEARSRPRRRPAGAGAGRSRRRRIRRQSRQEDPSSAPAMPTSVRSMPWCACCCRRPIRRATTPPTPSPSRSRTRITARRAPSPFDKPCEKPSPLQRERVAARSGAGRGAHAMILAPSPGSLRSPPSPAKGERDA